MVRSLTVAARKHRASRIPTGFQNSATTFFETALVLKKTAESLKRLRPALITTPNFSMHADAIRHDNLVSMARIAACFEEFAAARLPVALHVNSRTPRDFQRWAEYLISSPGVDTVAYEMSSLGHSSIRRRWHAQQLIALAHYVGRPLTLVIRAGSEHLTELAAAFSRVIHLDSSARMKAKYRQTARYEGGKLSWIASPTAARERIDDLFLANVRAVRRMTRVALARNDGHYGRSKVAGGLGRRNACVEPTMVESESSLLQRFDQP